MNLFGIKKLPIFSDAIDMVKSSAEFFDGLKKGKFDLAALGDTILNGAQIASVATGNIAMANTLSKIEQGTDTLGITSNKNNSEAAKAQSLIDQTIFMHGQVS